jgi:hypothetical protein
LDEKEKLLEIKYYMKKIIISNCIFVLCMIHILIKGQDSVAYVGLLTAEKIVFYKNGEYKHYRALYQSEFKSPCFVYSFGTYYKKNNFYYLNSNPILDSANVDVSVNENEFNSNFLTIYITSPYEEIVSNNSKYDKIYQYYITLYSTDTNDSVFKNDYQITNNIFQISRNKLNNIDSINITIELKCPDIESFFEKISYVYPLKKESSNFFLFNFHNFDYHYFYHKRYNEYPISILKSDVILFCEKENFCEKFYTMKKIEKIDQYLNLKLFFLKKFSCKYRKFLREQKKLQLGSVEKFSSLR